MRLVIALFDRWWDNRFHPMARVGFDRIVEGWRRGKNPEMALGLGMLLFGMSRQRPRRRVYATDLVAGESIGIRVLQRGEVVSEMEIPGPEV